MSILGSDLDASLPELRAEAESLMITGCVLERKTGSRIDPDNGQRIDEWSEIWSGTGAPSSPGCKVVTSREAREIVVGGQRVTTKPTVVCVPHHAPMAQLADRFVTDRGTFYVAGIEHHSWVIQQRYTCAENQEVVG